jgi:hypothetical protein
MAEEEKNVDQKILDHLNLTSGDKEENKEEIKDENEGVEKKEKQDDSVEKEEKDNNEDVEDKDDDGDDKKDDGKGTEDNKDDKEAAEFSLDNFNEQFGTDFSDQSKLKEVLSETDKLRESLKEKEELIEKYNKQIDPLSNFAGKDDKEKQAGYIIEQIYKNNPDSNRAVIGEIVQSDLDNISDEQALVLRHIFERPSSISKRGQVEDFIKNKYGLDKDVDEDDYDAKKQVEMRKFEMASEADVARRQLKELVNKVEMPSGQSIEEIEKANKEAQEKQQKELLNEWEPKIGTVEKVGVGDFEYEIPEKERADILERAKNLVVSQNIKPTKDAIEDVERYMKDEYLLLNKDKIFEAYKKHIISQKEDEHYNETHNPKKKNENEAPEPKGDKSAEDKVLERLEVK